MAHLPAGYDDWITNLGADGHVPQWDRPARPDPADEVDDGEPVAVPGRPAVHDESNPF